MKIDLLDACGLVGSVFCTIILLCSGEYMAALGWFAATINMWRVILFSSNNGYEARSKETRV